VSAHWNTERPAVSTAERPETIHDFYGFPDDLYRLHYDAPGAPELAQRVAKLVGADCDPGYGLDHGAWVPAMLGWPDATIPIFQLSVQPYMTPAHHIALGRKLSTLREEGILVMGSGSATHNLRRLVRGQHGAKPEPWAKEFDDWLADTLEAGDESALANYRTEAPHAGGPSDRRALPAAACRFGAREGARGSRCTAASLRQLSMARSFA
jgi:4,5-DOPA dioxygenase extradiol